MFQNFRFLCCLENCTISRAETCSSTNQPWPQKRKCAPGGAWGGGFDCGSNQLKPSPAASLGTFLAEQESTAAGRHDKVAGGAGPQFYRGLPSIHRKLKKTCLRRGFIKHYSVLPRSFSLQLQNICWKYTKYFCAAILCCKKKSWRQNCKALQKRRFFTKTRKSAMVRLTPTIALLRGIG